MKIAIIHNQFSRGGGMEAYMLLLVKGFLAAGDTVTIHTYEVDRQLATRFPCAIRLTKLPPLPGRWKKYLFLQKCNANFNREEYDISLSLTRTSCQLWRPGQVGSRDQGSGPCRLCPELY